MQINRSHLCFNLFQTAVGSAGGCAGPAGPAGPARPQNRAGVPMALGSGSTASNYYCGRRLGTSVIPGSDGQCGPNNGPQCPDCKGLTRGSESLLASSTVSECVAIDF